MLVYTVVAFFWFATGATSAAWFMHCGRTGKSPLPISIPFLNRSQDNGKAEVPAPRSTSAAIPSRAGN